MRKFLFILLLITTCSLGAAAQNRREMVELEITDKDSSVRVVKFKWPITSGPKSVGGKSEAIKIVESICANNGIDCPPKREKISENVWRCSNGKRIRTKDEKLAKLLSNAWDEK